jgi:hypothetical protein
MDLNPEPSRTLWAGAEVPLRATSVVLQQGRKIKRYLPPRQLSAPAVPPGGRERCLGRKDTNAIDIRRDQAAGLFEVVFGAGARVGIL